MFLLGVGRLQTVPTVPTATPSNLGFVYLYDSSMGPVYYNVVVGTLLLL